MVAIIIPGRYGPLIAGGTSGGSVTPITLTAPNDFTNAAWTNKGNLTINPNNGADPLGGSAACALTSLNGTFAGAQQVAGTLTNGVHYSCRLYVSSLGTGPNYARFYLYDVIDNQYAGLWLNHDTGVKGGDMSGGSSTVHSAGTTSLGTFGGLAWYRVDFEVSFVTTRAFDFHMDFDGGAGDSDATVGQDMQVYAVCA